MDKSWNDRQIEKGLMDRYNNRQIRKDKQTNRSVEKWKDRQNDKQLQR